MQAKIGLAMLLKNFRFETSSKTKTPLTFKKNLHILLSPENGIQLKVVKIWKFWLVIWKLNKNIKILNLASSLKLKLGNFL